METTENPGQDGVKPEIGVGDGANGEVGAVVDATSETAASGSDAAVQVKGRGRPPKASKTKDAQPEVSKAASAEFPDAVLIDMQPQSAIPSSTDGEPTPIVATSSWHEFAEQVQAIEANAPDRRLVRVWHPQPKAEVLNGVFAGAEVQVGNPAYQWSDGEIVTL